MNDGAQPARPPSTRPRPVATAILAAATVALALVLADLVATRFGPLQDVSDAGDGVLFVLFAFATFLPLTLVAGLFFGHVLYVAERLWGLPGWPQRVWRRLRDDGAVDRTTAAVLASVLLGLAGFFLSTRPVLTGVPGGGTDPLATKFSAALLLLLLLLWAGVGLCAFPVARFVLGRLRRVLPFPVTLLLASVAGLAVAVVGVKGLRLAIGNEELRNYFRLPLLLFSGPFLVAVVLGLLLYWRNRRPLRWVFHPSVRLTQYVALALALGYGMLGLGRHPQIKATIFTDTVYCGLAVAAYQSLFDLDGDGFSTVFGGPDGETLESTGAAGQSIAWPRGPARSAVVPAASSRVAGSDDRRPAQAHPRRLNVVVILMDTLRADHVGACGYERDTTPNLDRLAARSVVFERAYAQGNNTPTSIPSIFTSRMPSSIAWGDPAARFPRVEGRETLLGEAMRSCGYATAGVSAHWYFTPGLRGLAKGFDTWDNTGGVQDGEERRVPTSEFVVGKLVRALERLGGGDRPFLVFAHLFDAHGPHLPCDAFPDDPCFGDRMVDRYDTAVRHADRQLGEVFAALAGLGLEDETVVVVAADHGEAFDEHNVTFHGTTLYDEEVHVPLIVHVPGVVPARVPAPVALIDLYPTLVDLGGGTLPPTAQGRSLLPAILRGPTTDASEAGARPILLECRPPRGRGDALRGVVLGQLKLTYNLHRDYWELYDLAVDPGERRNLFFSHPLAASLQRYVLPRGARTASLSRAAAPAVPGRATPERPD